MRVEILELRVKQMYGIAAIYICRNATPKLQGTALKHYYAVGIASLAKAASFARRAYITHINHSLMVGLICKKLHRFCGAALLSTLVTNCNFGILIKDVNF